MKRYSLVTTFLIISAVINFPGSVSAQNANARQISLLHQSSLVFTGDIVRMGDVSFKGVKKSSNTVVIKLKNVLLKPGTVSIPRNNLITVKMKDPGNVEPGTYGVFYTNGYLFGEGIAAKEVGHITGSPEELTYPENMKQIQEDQNLREHLKPADLVALGAIKQIRDPKTKREIPPPDSEHNPQWKEAVVTLQNVIKGDPGTKKVIVRFPGSMDVAWYRIPKLKEQQTATLILRKDKNITGLEKPKLEGKTVPVYVIQGPMDVHPRSAIKRINDLRK